MEGSAILIAHSGKGRVAAFRHNGLAHKIAADDLKIVRVGAACIYGFGKQAAADGKRGVTSFGDNLAVKQAVFDDDGGVIIREGHTLFKGSALDLGLHAGGGVYLDNFLKGAAGDGSVVAHIPLEVTIGDDAGVVHRSLEGAAGDDAGDGHIIVVVAVVVVHLSLEGAVGDDAPVDNIPLEGAAGDDAGDGPLIVVVAVVVHHPLEGAAGDGAVIAGSTADGAAVKFGIFNTESCLQCAFRPGIRGGLQGKNAIVQPTTGVSAVVPMGTVAATFGRASGIQLDGKTIGGAVLRVQITAAAGGGFLLGAAGGVGLLYKGCSLFGRGLGGCIEHRGSCQCRHRQQGQQHTAGQQDAYNAFGFHKVSLLSCGFYTGCRYHKYTIN